jgi:hypothetical protein
MTFQETFQYYKEQAIETSVLEACTALLKANNLPVEKIILGIKPNDAPKQLVVVTEGEFGPDKPQTIKIPENIFDFPPEMVLNMLAHEFHHVEQKTALEPIMDKNEREFQAYYEGVFPSRTPQLPPCPIWLKKQLVAQALRYYGMMEAGGPLQAKYLTQKYLLEEWLLENTEQAST